MPIHGYAGGVISATPVVPTSTSASGVWTTELQAQALAAGNWPNASSQIARSLRFNSADSANLSRTVTTTSNRQTFTFSMWCKLGAIGTTRRLYGGSINANNEFSIYLSTNNNLWLYDYQSAYNLQLTTTQVFRDPSAWYHFVFAIDTTQATASNRAKIYVNGVQVTAFSTATYPSQNYNTLVNSSSTPDNRIGVLVTDLSYFDGYMADFYFIDGQALTPSSFGYTDPNTGVWVPNAYNGSYGTNGFHLNFYNNTGTTSTTLGLDTSGNGNNWTPNNFSVTAGAGNDSLVDTPTPYGSDTGAGGEVRGNYCTLNPLNVNSSVTLSNGNLNLVTPSSGYGMTYSTFGMSSGKWYWEVTVVSNSGGTDIGINKATVPLNEYMGQNANSWAYLSSANKRNNNSASSYGASFTDNDVIGVALDLDAGTLVFYKNGASQGTAYSSLSGEFFPAFSDDSNGAGVSLAVNFGQRPFAYTAPSGFKALCTTNLPTPAIGATSTTQANRYFDIRTIDGSNSDQSITDLNFAPDFLWAKSRSNVVSHGLYDTIRGGNKILFSDLTDAENTTTSNIVTFLSNGVTLQGGGSVINTGGRTYVDWFWKGGGTGVSNTQGTITSTVSANTTSGFSIVTWTANGSNADSIGHGLGATPKMIIYKRRDGADAWYVWTTAIDGSNDVLVLNTTAAKSDISATYGSPTSTTISNYGLPNAWTMVAYCFAPVAGYSAFGSYTGNGDNDGPFVYTGFRPAYLLIKRSSLAGADWNVIDNKRGPYNPVIPELAPNTSGAEDNYLDNRDFLSNGFKVRSNQGIVNTSGETYIYAAFAEYPFKYANAR